MVQIVIGDNEYDGIARYLQGIGLERFDKSNI